MLDKDTYKDLTQAIWKAREAFEKHLSKCGYDTAYFTVRITAWELTDGDFKPLEKIEYDCREGRE